MSAVLVAVFVTMASILSPLLLSTLNTHQQRMMKREDYARQDVVAERAAEAARLLLQRQNSIASEVHLVAEQAAETAERLVESNAAVATKVAVVAENANLVNERLDVIHTLVNSAMTAAIQSQHDDKVTTLAMMREVVALRSAGGHGGPDAETVAALKATEENIVKLKETLIERHKQDELAKAQVVKIVSAEGLRRKDGS